MLDSKRPALDKAIHPETRLSILGRIRQAGTPVDFTTLREELALSGGNLLSHLRALEQAGVLKSHKENPLGRQRTLYSLTEEGEKRVKQHATVLRSVAETLLGGPGRG